ncbi:MAG: hypothetical protein LBG16_04790, partial [Elusimicrobiota bacterium]|nr:hypothetical protein [Elusimicrobiota bacterium]
IREALLAEGGLREEEITEEAYRAVYDKYFTEKTEEEADIRRASKALRQAYPLDFAQERFDRHLFELLQNDPEQACINRNCFEINAYMMAALEYMVERGISGLGKIYKSSLGYAEGRDFGAGNINDPQRMIGEIYWINRIIEKYGVREEMAGTLSAYASTIIEKAGDFCDSGHDFDKKSERSLASGGGNKKLRKGLVRQWRQRDCGNVGETMALLTAVSGDDVKESAKAAALIYKTINDVKREDLGSGLAVMGIMSLANLDTSLSWQYIDKFLTDKTIPAGSFREEGGKILDLLSISEWSKKGIDVAALVQGTNGRYHNNMSMRYDYLEEGGSLPAGYEDMISEVQAGFNITFANAFEDIGHYIGSLRNNFAEKLTEKILNKYVAKHNLRSDCMRINNSDASYTCDAGYHVHTPLVVGLIEGNGAHSGAGKAAAAIIAEGKWWDINEATQRRINNIARAALGQPAKQYDAEKQKKYKQNARIIFTSGYVDFIVSVICIAMVVKSVPSLLRSGIKILSNSSRVRTVVKAGRGELLKSVRSGMKKQGITRGSINAARKQLAQKQQVAQSAARTKQSSAVAQNQRAAQGTAKAEQSSAVGKNQGPQKGTIEVRLSGNKVKPEQDLLVRVKSNGRIISKRGILAEVPASGTLQPLRPQLTAQVGGMGGGGAASTQAPPAVGNAVSSYRVIPTRPYVPKPAGLTGNINTQKPAQKFMRSARLWFEWNIRPFFSVAGQTIKAPFRSMRGVATAVMGGATPLGTTVEMTALRTPAAIHSYVSAIPSGNLVRPFTQLADAANAAGQLPAAAGIAKTPMSLVHGVNTIPFFTPIYALEPFAVFGGAPNRKLWATVGSHNISPARYKTRKTTPVPAGNIVEKKNLSTNAFFVPFLSAVNIAVCGPIFQSAFAIADSNIKTITTLIGYVPLILAVWILVRFGKGVAIRLSGPLATGGVATAIAAGFWNFVNPGVFPVIAGALGLFSLSLSGWLRLSSLSPWAEAIFADKDYTPAVNGGFVGRHVGGISFLLPVVLGGVFGPVLSDASLIASSSLLLLLSVSSWAGINKMGLKDISESLNWKKTLKELKSLVSRGKNTIRNPLAVALAESAETAIILLLVFDLEQKFNFSVPMAVVSAIAVSALAIAGRVLTTYLSKNKEFSQAGTYRIYSAFSLLGVTLFALFNTGYLGLAGAVLALIGLPNTISPVTGVTSKKNPGYSEAISALVFLTVALSLFSGLVLDAAQSFAGGSAGFWVPLALEALAFCLSANVLSGAKTKSRKNSNINFQEE